jgi:outer membrane protein assembly factor BamB
VKRHSKSSHANPSIATDGKHVVAFFGSEGLYCYDMEGNQKWKLDLGLLDSGWFFNAAYQWGFGSSPIIFEDKVIVQCDIQKDSFIAAFRLSDGTEVWRTKRDEIPTWPTPNVHRFGDMPMLITHGTRAARGYDARDGALLWSLKGHSEIVVPTPFVAHDLIFVASGYSPVQPIVAIKPTMRGEIDLPGVQKDDGTTTPEANEQLAWSLNRGGPYMPTPIAYGDFLYCCSNTGILACYRATTGEEVYKERVKVGGAASFTASPIAADGHLYLTAEDGRVAVVRAGEKYKLVSVNPCGTNVLSTPAISAGTFFARTLTEIVAFGEKE